MSYSRSLEIELISAEELKVDRKPLKKKSYCIVRINEKSNVSKLDESGGSYPIWKDRFNMEIPINGSVRFISIEVYYQTKSGRAHKVVGKAKIPVTDFMGGFAPTGHLNFLSYRLRDEFGDKSGIVNVSIMVKPDANDHKSSLPSSSSSSSVGYVACSSQATADNQMWRQKTSSSSMASSSGCVGGRVVTGVPVLFEQLNNLSMVTVHKELGEGLKAVFKKERKLNNT